MKWCSVICWISLWIAVVEGNQRWYYTGKFWPSDEVVATKLFSGHVFRPLDLFTPTDEQRQGHILYAGGYALAHESNETEIAKDVEKFTQDEDLRGFLTNILGYDDYSLDLQDYHKYKIHLVPDYSAKRSGSEEVDVTGEVKAAQTSSGSQYEIFEAEIGLYDQMRGIFTEKQKYTVFVGIVYAVTLVNMDRVHKVLYTTDLYNRRSVLSHTFYWRRQEGLQPTEQDGGSSSSSNEKIPEEREANAFDHVRIMTYNLWHNNPPSWVYHDPRYVTTTLIHIND